MILRKVVEYYVFFICAKSRHCSWKSTRDIFVFVCFSVFVHVNCATDHGRVKRITNKILKMKGKWYLNLAQGLDLPLSLKEEKPTFCNDDSYT